MVTKVYLAARYARREELRGYRSDLESLGVTVTSRWLDETHTPAESLALDSWRQSHYASKDIGEISEAGTFIIFTTEPKDGYGTGGCHVETGVAIAYGREVIIVGPRENVFHHLRHIEQFDT